MKTPVHDATIVGGMFSAQGRSPFDEVDLVVRRGGKLLRVEAYLGDSADGTEYTDDEWRALCRDGQATDLGWEGEQLEAGAVLWILRSRFDSRDTALRELRTSGALALSPRRLAEGPGSTDHSVVCVVLRAKGAPLMVRWAARSVEDAMRHALADCWDVALTCAEQAFALKPELDAETLALLVLAYENNDRTRRAQGYLAMAEASKGKRFRSAVEHHLGTLRQRLHPANRSAREHVAARGPSKVRWQKAAAEHRQKGLDCLDPGRAAA